MKNRIALHISIIRRENEENIDKKKERRKLAIVFVLEEWKAQKIEVKVLEDKVATYMKSVIALEDEQRKNGVLKTRIESLQLVNSELETRLNGEIRRADKVELNLLFGTALFLLSMKQ